MAQTTGTFDYEYFIKDHLGNTRVVVKDTLGNALVKQENHYDPFGYTLAGQTFNYSPGTKKNDYLYNGKELQDELGLDWYDYGARFYDAAIGRWHSLDPKSEQTRIISPYAYAYNDPIYFIDKDGEAPIGYIYYELRVVVPILGELGITASFNAGIYFEMGGNWTVGAGYSGSLGFSAGKGVFLGINGGLNWDADQIDQLNDFGSNAGAAVGLPKKIPPIGIEKNWAIDQNLNTKGGLSFGIPFGPGFSLGYTGYGEGSLTKIRKYGSVSQAIASIFDPMITECDRAIRDLNRYSLNDPLSNEIKEKLKDIKDDLYRRKIEISSKLEAVHKMMKDNYMKLNENEKKEYNNRKVNSIWAQLMQLIFQVLANGGTVTIN